MITGPKYITTKEAELLSNTIWDNDDLWHCAKMILIVDRYHGSTTNVFTAGFRLFFIVRVKIRKRLASISIKL
jgi:hypothetical protein